MRISCTGTARVVAVSSMGQTSTVAGGALFTAGWLKSEVEGDGHHDRSRMLIYNGVSLVKSKETSLYLSMGDLRLSRRRTSFEWRKTEQKQEAEVQAGYRPRTRRSSSSAC